jgi:Flp pilus assembly pilin Flp
VPWSRSSIVEALPRNFGGPSPSIMRDRRGAGLVEYLIVVGLVAVFCLAGWRAFGAEVDAKASAQSACVDTFSCGPGGAEGAEGTAAAMPIQGAAALPPPGAAPAPAPAPPPAPAPAPESRGLGTRILDVGKGVVVDGLWGTITGLYQVVRHPIQTVEGLGNAIAHPIATAEAIGGAISDAWDENPERVAGAAVFEIITAPLAVAKAGKVARGARIADAADDLTDATRVARVADRADDGADTARAAEQAAAARRAEQLARLDDAFGSPQPPVRIKDFELGPDGAPLLNPTRQVIGPGTRPVLDPSKDYIFLLDREGRLIIGEEVPVGRLPDGRPARLGHPTLSGGEPARIGGEIRFDPQTGRPVINNLSGRYSNHPDRGALQLEAAAQRFREAGIDVDTRFIQMTPQ